MFEVMVAEDNAYILKELCKNISWEKYEMQIVASYPNGKTLLEAAKLQMPDIVVTDISMPIMDGISLAKELRQLSSNVRIIFVSGHADFKYAQQAIGLRVSGYILKPFEKTQFDEVLQLVRGELLSVRAGGIGQIKSEVQDHLPDQGNTKDYVKKMKAFVRKHYMESISTADVAESVFLSSNYANQKFVAECGYTVFDYIAKCRIEEAKRLLLETDESIQQISERVGYHTKTNFYLLFKKKTGMAPQHYRNTYRKQNSDN